MKISKYAEKLNNRGGMTLLEVMISIVIMGIALLMLLNMGMVALTSNDWSNNATSLSQAVQQKLEELRNTPNPTSGTETINGIELKWAVTTVSNHLRKIEITAAWEDLTSSEKSTSLTAYQKTDAA